MNDLRLAFRQLLKFPGFTVVAVFTLALGIGAGTAIFSLINGILLSSLPVPNPQQLRVIQWSGAEAKIPSYTGDDDGSGAASGSFSHTLFRIFREQCSAKADIFGYVPLDCTARAHREAFVTSGLMISDNFFTGLAARPLFGRLLGPEDDRTGEPTIVISYRLWGREFDFDSGAIGQSISLNGKSFTIVGVLPQGFPGVQPGAGTEFYVSLSCQPQMMPDCPPATSESWWWVRLMARMKSPASDAQLQGQLNLVFSREAKTFMKAPKVLLTDGQAGPARERNLFRRPLLLLLGIVGVVLLVVCANLAGLMLARGTSRQHEFSLRAALGATRLRLVRQSLTESVLVALLGGGLGITLATWGSNTLSRLLAGSIEGLRYNTSLDLRVLAFALAISLLAALLSGLLPALNNASADALIGIKERTPSKGYRRTMHLLIISQITLSLPLLVGAGLLGRTLLNLAHVNPGFRTENLLLFQLTPENAGYKEPRTTAFYDRVQQSLTAIPGVQSATLTLFPLLSGSTAGETFTTPGHALQGQPEIRPYTFIVGESFFTTMGIPILLGRELWVTDDAGAPKVVVVNDAFVHKYLPGQNPIGQTMMRNGTEWRIVGVCRDAKYASLKEETPPILYFSFRQHSAGSAYFALRTAGPPLAVAAAVRKTVAGLDPNIPLTNLKTERQVRHQAFLVERIFAALCGSLAAVAVLLSFMGLHGLLAYHVARRTHEIGIRMAIGAPRRKIAETILREAMALVAAGVSIGSLLALTLTRFVRANLYGVQAFDPTTVFAAVALLFLIALIAAWMPARRAISIDPMKALRYE